MTLPWEEYFDETEYGIAWCVYGEEDIWKETWEDI
jgi:hypothetical protein